MGTDWTGVQTERGGGIATPEPSPVHITRVKCLWPVHSVIAPRGPFETETSIIVAALESVRRDWHVRTLEWTLIIGESALNDSAQRHSSVLSMFDTRTNTSYKSRSY